MNEPGGGRRAACRAATPRRFSKPLPTSTVLLTTTWRCVPAGKRFERVDTIYPNINDGVEGMYFIQQSVASSQENGAWLPLKHPSAAAGMCSGRVSIR